ncbi:MAG: DUF2202 domain-containing protein [Planctomycetales bacterium]|nr:DUF2202 domain-containing protein [Planctomycetales bacterium]
MRTFTTATLAALVACGLAVSVVSAQRGVGRQQGISRQADKPELVSLSGVVVEVKSGPCEQTTGRAAVGTHLVINTADGQTHEIHVGPQREAESLIKDVRPEQQISVVGFRTDELAEDVLVAKSLETLSQTIELRDDTLRPVWAGGQGHGRGRGPQAGMRQGRGPGAGMGQGRGPGQGRGRGPAMTAGQGPGRRQGKGRGMQQGQGRGFCGGNGQGACGACQAQGAAKGRARGWGGAAGGQFCLNEGGGCGQQLSTLLESKPKGELSQADREGLQLMREEEKLANDVYVTLGKRWDLRPFQNIPRAESQHMEAVKMLLDRYQIEDPITDMTVGVFQNKDIQKLYNDLVSQGERSVEDAIKVGALIEELDIADLQRLIQDAKSDDLRTVYDVLVRGSRNHLRAFARQLQRFNTSYEAKHLSQEEFDRIAAGDHERGMPLANPAG